MAMIPDTCQSGFSDWSEVRSTLPREARQRSGPFVIEVAGKRYFVKVGGSPAYSWLRIVLLAPVVRLATGTWPDSRPLRRGGAERLAFEVKRLQALREAGVHVPAVKVHLEQLLVLEDVGETLESGLPYLDDVQRMERIRRLAEDLAAFHAAGHWHGGAQLRNVTFDDGRFGRIDFEEDLEGVLPLRMRQAMDALLAAFSIAHSRALGEPERRRPLVECFLSTWVREADGTAAMDELLRIRRWLKPLGWIASAMRAVPSRDLDAFRILANSMKAMEFRCIEPNHSTHSTHSTNGTEP